MPSQLAGQSTLQEWFSEGRDRSISAIFLPEADAGAGFGAVDPYGLINTQRTLLYRELHALTKQRSRVDPKRQMARLLLLDKAAMQLEADLRWLEMTELHLDEIRRQPLPEPEARPRGRPRRAKSLESW